MEESLRKPIELFGSPLFFNNLLDGFANATDSFVRSRYIYVITIGIWTLSDAFADENLKEILGTILDRYFEALLASNATALLEIDS